MAFATSGENAAELMLATSKAGVSLWDYLATVLCFLCVDLY